MDNLAGATEKVEMARTELLLAEVGIIAARVQLDEALAYLKDIMQPLQTAE
jgi:hypothetical protein